MSIEKLLSDMVEAIKQNTEELRKANESRAEIVQRVDAATGVSKPTKAAPKSEPKAEKPAEESTPSGPSFDDVKNKMTEYKPIVPDDASDAYKEWAKAEWVLRGKNIQKIFEKLNVKKVSDVPVDKYSAVIAALDAYIAKGNVGEDFQEPTEESSDDPLSGL